MRQNRQWHFTGIWILVIGLWVVTGIIAGIINSKPVSGQTEPLVSRSPNPLTAPEKTQDNPVEMTDIHDIKPLEPLGFNPAYMVYGLLALLMLSLGIAGWLYWQKRRGKKIIELAETPLPPEEIALNAIDHLFKNGFGDGRKFYFELSAILRNYLQARFAVNAPEMTSEELLPLVEILSVDREWQQNLKELIRSADPVKFAAYPVQASKMEGDITFVRQFVIQTTPVEQEI